MEDLEGAREVCGSVDVELAVPERDGGGPLQERAGAGISAKGEQLRECGRGKEGGDTVVAGVGGGGNLRGSHDGGKVFRGDGGLIANHKNGAPEVLRKGLDGESDGGGHALLPVGIDDGGHAFEGGAGGDLFMACAEDDEDGRAAGLAGDADGAVEESFAVERKKLLGLTEAGGSSGGEEDGSGRHRRDSGLLWRSVGCEEFSMEAGWE